jgi:ABC-2 type transport system ATP-binding protein
MGLRRLPRAKVIVAVVVAVALVTAGIALAVALTRPAPPTIRDVRIPVLDGPRGNQRVVLDASFFTPAGAGRVPAVLLAHGFGETKDAVRPEAENLARAGFAVLTWSARGFGASTGQIGLNSPDYEVKDVEQLISWLARQPRVLLDRPGDPRVGITGASYGGGISLLAAAYDHRIDAVVAQSTWNNLATALFPNGAGGGPANGVFKRQWAGLLFTQGSVGFGSAGQGQAGGQPAQGGQSGSGSQSGGSQSGGGSQPGGGGQPGQVLPSAGPGKFALCGPVPGPDLRHVPAGRRHRAAHRAGHLAIAALKPGQCGGQDARPHPAHPG